jgi:anti-sigma28 factor (negative regulator of flagellin synthesis)
MKISEQGLTERIPSQAQANRTTSVSDTAKASSSQVSGNRTSSDTLQLSNLASRVQSTSSGDASRAARLSQIAKAVQSNTYPIDPARISKAMVSEAVRTKAG